MAHEGDGRYLVKATAKGSPRAAIAQTIVGRGWPLLELTPMGMSLERIFLELTADAGVVDETELEMDTDAGEEDGDA